MYKEYKNTVDFKIVYIKEAHPTDGWRTRGNDREGIIVADPTTAEERQAVAGVCVANLKISIPTVIDNMENTVELAYHGWPDRIYIIGKDGKVAYKSGRGPMGFKPKEAEEALKIILAEGA
ncbi:MAG: deiodinase [Armatimonadetes bacterium]|nr:deiodinase [Armatimonadota bacterium]